MVLEVVGRHDWNISVGGRSMTCDAVRRMSCLPGPELHHDARDLFTRQARQPGRKGLDVAGLRKALVYGCEWVLKIPSDDTLISFSPLALDLRTSW